ncbi:MAG: hypothetical protein R2733_24180 [Acidimicrobiales bacterium]
MERAWTFLDAKCKLEEFVANRDVCGRILDCCHDVDRMEAQPLAKLNRSPSLWISAPEVRDELEDKVVLNASSNSDCADEQRFDVSGFVEPWKIAVNGAVGGVAEHEQDTVGTGQSLKESQRRGADDRLVRFRHLEMVHRPVGVEEASDLVG